MSFMDSVSQTLNGGASKAGRVGQIAKLSLQLTSLEQQREKMLGQLGACVYPHLSASPDLVPEAKGLVDDLARLDAGMADIRNQIDEAKVEVAEPIRQHATDNGGVPYQAPTPVQDVETVVCPRCGSLVTVGSKFCGVCGLPMEQVQHPQVTQGGSEQGSSVAGWGASAAAQQSSPSASDAQAGDGSATAGVDALADAAAGARPGHAEEGSGSAGTPSAAPQDEMVPEPQQVTPTEPAAATEAAPSAASAVGSQPVTAPVPEPVATTPAARVTPAAETTPLPQTEPQPKAAPAAQPQGRHCPTCGSIVGPTDKFCMICGTRLQ